MNPRESGSHTLSVSASRPLDILDHLLFFVAVLDSDGTLRYVNRAALEASEVTPEAVIGVSFADTPWWNYDPKARSRLQEAIGRAARGETSRYNERVWAAPERFLTVDFMLAPIRNDGAVTSIIASAVDITERRQVEAERAESDARYRTLFNATDEGFCVIEVLFEDDRPVDYRFLETNPRFEAQTGLKDAVGRTARELVPNLEEHWFEIYGRVALTGKSTRFENGSEEMGRWFDVYAFRVGGEASRRVGILFTDTTERKRAERALRESETRFRGTFENAAVGLGHVGMGGEWLRVNKTLCEIVGYSKEELLTMTFQDLTHPDDLEADRERFAQLMRGETDSYTMEKRYFHKDGHTVWIELTMALQKGESGAPLYGISVVEDVSARKAAEEQVRQLNDTLESLVEARTAKLEAANRELETFSYSVSHDLRAPLRGIDGFSQTLLEDYREGDTLDATAIHYLQRVRTGAQRMGELIDDLLSLSRLSRSELRRSEVDVSELVADVAAELARRHPGREVALHVSGGVVAVGDGRLLRVALENLLENAWKYTRDHPGAEVSFGVSDDGEERVYFVRDNGVGFDMRYANKLFAPFRRLHAPDRFEGTGIGLATVQRVVHLHGGRVWADSEVGEGATFYFTLPEEGMVAPGRVLSELAQYGI